MAGLAARGEGPTSNAVDNSPHKSAKGAEVIHGVMCGPSPTCRTPLTRSGRVTHENKKKRVNSIRRQEYRMHYASYTLGR